MRIGGFVPDPETDFEDVDCADCGHKFFVSPSTYNFNAPNATCCFNCRTARIEFDAWWEREGRQTSHELGQL